MKKIILILLTIGIWSQSLAQTFDKTKLDNYLNALEANAKFMGSVALSKDGKIIYSKTVGFSDIEHQIKADIKTKYRIGSISKTFTTVMVLKAVEDKKLALDQTIETYFPSIENANKISLRQLLNHRSGIHNFTNDESYLTWNTEAKTETEMVELIANSGSDFTPDSKAEYSNSNFVLLTYILEKTYKKSFSKLLQELIIEPIGLENTQFGGKINLSENECNSYRFTSEWKLETETDISIPLGAGGIISTPSDLTIFSDALFNGKLLKPESLEIMKTIKEGYGIGLFNFPFYEHIGFGHTGGIDGFSSVFSYFPEDNITYALTSNGTNYNSNSISIAVMSAVFGKPYEIPEFSTYQYSEEDLEVYLGVYASEQIPLKITVTREGNLLFAQGTGQPTLPLEATDIHMFKVDQVSAVFEFNPKEQTMILKQGGGELLFKKE